MTGTLEHVLGKHVHEALPGRNVEGLVRPGFEAVRYAFVENFERCGELGAACSF